MKLTTDVPTMIAMSMSMSDVADNAEKQARMIMMLMVATIMICQKDGQAGRPAQTDKPTE